MPKLPKTSTGFGQKPLSPPKPNPEAEFAIGFLYWDHSLYEWLDKTKVSSPEGKRAQSLGFKVWVGFAGSNGGKWDD